MKASKLDIEKLIEKVDFNEIMILQHFSDCGSRIHVWEDGGLEVMGQGTYPGNTDLWYAVINCFGRGNIDESAYSEGWAEEQETEVGRQYIETATGLIMTPDEMIRKCLEEGDFVDSIEMIKDQIRDQHQEDIDREDEANAID